MWNINYVLLFVPLFINGQTEDVNPLATDVYTDPDQTQRTHIPYELQRTPFKFSNSPVRGIPRPIPPPIYFGPFNTKPDPLTHLEEQEKLATPNVQTIAYPALQYHRSEILKPIPENNPTHTDDHEFSSQTGTFTYSPPSYTASSRPDYNSVQDFYTENEPNLSTPIPPATELKTQENSGPKNYTILLDHQSSSHAVNCTCAQVLPTYFTPSQETAFATEPILVSSESTTILNVPVATTSTPKQTSPEIFLPQRPSYLATRLPVQASQESPLPQPLPTYFTPSQETTFTTEPLLPYSELITLPNVPVETASTPKQTSSETFLPQRPSFWASRLPVQPNQESLLPQPLPTYFTPSQETTFTIEPLLPSSESTTLPNVPVQSTSIPKQTSTETFLRQQPLYWTSRLPVQPSQESLLPQPLPTYFTPSQETTFTTEPLLPSSESTTLPNVPAQSTSTPKQTSPETFLRQRPLYWTSRLPVQPSQESSLPQPLATHNTPSQEITFATKPILSFSELTTLPNLAAAITTIPERNFPETISPQQPLLLPVQPNHEQTLPPTSTKSPSATIAAQPTAFVPKYNVRPIPSTLIVPIEHQEEYYKPVTIANTSTPIPVINDNIVPLPQALTPQVSKTLTSELEPPSVQPAPLFTCVSTVPQIPTPTFKLQPVLGTETESPKIILPQLNTETIPEYTITPKPSLNTTEPVPPLAPQNAPVYSKFDRRVPPPVFTRLPETPIVATPPQIVSLAPSPPNPSVYRPVMPNAYKPLSQPSIKSTFGVSTKNYSTFFNIHCDAENYYYRAENWCDTFIECKNFTPTVYSCPDGLYFNPNSLWPDSPCDSQSHVLCKGKTLGHETESSKQCLHKFGTFSIDGECSRYVVCEDGVATVMNCPPGLAFSSKTSTCDWPENVPYCNPEVFKGFECPNPPLDEYGNPSDILTNHRYGDSCTHYIACHQNQPRLLSCDPGYVFDDTTARCVNEHYSTACSSH